MKQCELCGKRSSTAGNNVSHSNRHTKRTFKSNIHKTKFTVNGETTNINVCANCLKTMKKEAK